MLSNNSSYKRVMTKEGLVLRASTCYLPDDIGSSTNQCILGLVDRYSSYLQQDYVYYKARPDLTNTDNDYYLIYIPIVIPEDEVCAFDLTFLNDYISDTSNVQVEIRICVFDPRSASVGYLDRYDEMDRGDYVYPFIITSTDYIKSLHLNCEIGFDQYQVRYNYYSSDGPTNYAQDL